LAADTGVLLLLSMAHMGTENLLTLIHAYKHDLKLFDFLNQKQQYLPNFLINNVIIIYKKIFKV
jgi:hypothetical protein